MRALCTLTQSQRARRWAKEEGSARVDTQIAKNKYTVKLLVHGFRRPLRLGMAMQRL